MSNIYKDFEKFLEDGNTPKPYYEWHQDLGAKAFLEDAKKAIESGKTVHARLCIQWAKEAQNELKNTNKKAA